MRKKIFIIILLFMHAVLNSEIRGQNDSTNHDIDYLKLSVVGGITLSGFVYGHLLQSDLWWKGEKSPFHFDWKHDWEYALGADKFTHIYFANLLTEIYSQAFEWTGIDEQKSLYYAALLSVLYETYVEVKDGFSKEWGFSWGDFAANCLGAGYPILQRRYPILKNFSFKISLFPSDSFRRGSHKAIIDDYESIYSWLSINVSKLLPDAAKKYYPNFINLAIGHGVKNLSDKNLRDHELFLSLDWNLEALPGDGSFLKLLKKNINLYRLPAPAVKIYPGFIWYGIKF